MLQLQQPLSRQPAPHHLARARQPPPRRVLRCSPRGVGVGVGVGGVRAVMLAAPAEHPTRDGVRVGVEPGTTGARFAESELESAQRKFFADPAAAFEGLRENEIDVYIHDAPTSWQLATADHNADLISLYHPLTEEQLAWAVRKDDARLADSLNAALRLMKRNGTLRYILNRWIPVTVEVR